jgi:hypothetical protein
MSTPLLLGMFHRRIEGDHHLLELAQRRFTEAGLGAEFYPTNLEDLQEYLEFRPLTEPRYTMHLPRNIRLLDRKGFKTITDFAGRGRTDAYGMIVHDQPEMATKPDDYIAAIYNINDALLKIKPTPYLFIEYAVGIDIDDFVAIFEATQDCTQVSACIDISHIGIYQTQQSYRKQYPGEDVCDIGPDHPALPHRIEDVVSATETALPTVLDVIERLGALGKPLHFHLHDGHPLSTFSLYGVSDHLSFLHEICLPFAYNGQHTIPLMFGPASLKKIVQTASSKLPGEQLSFMLEIHPQYDRLELGQYANLFINWKETQNAEQMNAWLERIINNLRLLRVMVDKI